MVRRVSVQREGGVMFEKKECESLVCPATRQASTDDRLCDNILDGGKEESIDMPYLSEAGPANKKTILGVTNQYLITRMETGDWLKVLQISAGRLPECNFV